MASTRIPNRLAYQLSDNEVYRGQQTLPLTARRTKINKLINISKKVNHIGYRNPKKLVPWGLLIIPSNEKYIIWEIIDGK